MSRTWSKAIVEGLWRPPSCGLYVISYDLTEMLVTHLQEGLQLTGVASRFLHEKLLEARILLEISFKKMMAELESDNCLQSHQAAQDEAYGQ